MAFLSQLTDRLQTLKESAATIAEGGAPAITAHFQSLKDGAPRLLESAKSAKTGLMNKVGLDSLGKMLSVSGDRKQSPIDILPVQTAYGEHLANASFRLEYDRGVETKAVNAGGALWMYREGNESELALSFLAEEQFHLDAINWHWGTEPMNGSEHIIGGVGYAGEVHLYHRNTRFPTMEAALKQPNGVFAIAIFLNETHDNNEAFTQFINLLQNVTYKGNECRLANFDPCNLLPSPEKSKEFWLYEGSETVEPFRETVNWIVFRSALPIASAQLERLRAVKACGYDEEKERPMLPLRAVQSANGRTILSSFRSAANAPNLGFNAN